MVAFSVSVAININVHSINDISVVRSTKPQRWVKNEKEKRLHVALLSTNVTWDKSV